MNNCLVTKLKSSVNNPELPYMSAAVLHLDPDAVAFAPTKNNLYATAPAKLILNDGTEVDISTTQYFNFMELEAQDVQFISKYNALPCAGPGASYLQGVTIKLDDFKYYTGNATRWSCQLSNLVGDLGKTFKSDYILELDFNNSSPLTGNLSEIFASFPNMESFNVGSNAAGGIVGDIAAYGQTKLSPTRTIVFPSGTYGNIYDVVNGFRTRSVNPYPTYNDCLLIAYTNKIKLFDYGYQDGGSGVIKYLSWTQNDVTLKDSNKNILIKYDNNGNVIPT